MDKIKLQIMGRESELYSIHYSCSGFYNGGAIAPTICSISLVNYKTKEMHTFAVQDYITQGMSLMKSEEQLLRDFIEFYNSIHSPIFVHWSMDGLQYGFKAINARAENFGLYDFNLAKLDDINLSKEITSNLITALDCHNCKRITVLSGKEEASGFDKRDYNIVKNSTIGKAFGILNLFERYLSDDIEKIIY